MRCWCCGARRPEAPASMLLRVTGLRPRTAQLTPRTDPQAALSVLECRGAQSKRNTTRHNSSGTNQVEPRCRKALMRETTGLCQPLPIDLSTYRRHARYVYKTKGGCEGGAPSLAKAQHSSRLLEERVGLSRSRTPPRRARGGTEPTTDRRGFFVRHNGQMELLNA